MIIPTERPQEGERAYKRRLKLFFVIERDGPKCKKCGEKSADALTLDHIIPKSLGGTHALSNLQILCRRCHTKKDRDTSHNAFMRHTKKERKKYKILEQFPYLRNTMWYEEMMRK